MGAVDMALTKEESRQSGMTWKDWLILLTAPLQCLVMLVLILLLVIVVGIDLVFGPKDDTDD